MRRGNVSTPVLRNDPLQRYRPILLTPVLRNGSHARTSTSSAQHMLRERRRAPVRSAGVVSEAPCRVNELGITMCFAQHDERLTNQRPWRECKPK